jgi:type VI secretion system secreted protein Hcp
MASDYLLELDGVKGESKDGSHPETIELLSFNFGASNPTQVGSSGMSAGKVSYTDMNVSFYMEQATVQLLTRVSTGKVIPKAVLYGRKSGDDKRLDYLKVTLSEVMVSSWQTSASDGSGIPMLSVSFAFSKIEYIYKPQNEDQTLGDDMIATYDLKAAKK